MALGIASFALLMMLALLPSGLETVRQAAGETALASIMRDVRAEVNQTPLKTVESILPTASWYYDESGQLLSTTGAQPEDSYYRVTFKLGTATLPSPAGSFDESMQALQVTVLFPASASATVQEKNKRVYSLLLSRQESAFTASTN